MWAKYTLIVPVGQVTLAKSLASGIAGDAANGMWTTGLSATGVDPASHYISSGCIHEEFGELFGDAQATFDACGGAVPLTSLQSLYAASTYIKDADPFEVMHSLGLKLINPTT